jgi:hypothetical protein
LTSSYEDTWLWRRAFVDPRADARPEQQEFFKLQLKDMRDRVAPLVARVASDMPGYTVHDITHLDALWETASLAASEALELNPPEAFVFGGAVLLHDAGMTLAAYPGGLSELQQTTEWQDLVALSGEGRADGKDRSPADEAWVTVEVLRRLHARKASELAVQGWPELESKGIHSENKGDKRFIIDNTELRHFYGSKIGLVAHSHWWPISKVAKELNGHLGGMPPRTLLRVDLLKIACLLRVADALHLDRRRASPFFRAITRPLGVSASHWTFQEKLAFPHLEEDAVVFTAGETFPVEEAAAWWLAFDAISLADRELRDADRLLRDSSRPGLQAKRIKGADTPSELARHVPVTGWKPIETRLRVSDVTKIVSTLGGKRLYGNDPNAPLRELLQNATDAVQARRRLQSRPSDWGHISVRLEKRTDDTWLIVEDCGVGMSEWVLTGPLLDFGSSFWRTEQAAEEFPTLAAKGMDAIGRFGIGFFSVFMLADEVRVVTRRYDRAEADALSLEFTNGLASRPILVSAPPGTAPLDGGTRVELKLRTKVKRGRAIRLADEDDQSLFSLDSERRTFGSLVERVAFLAPASNVSIDVSEFGTTSRSVTAGDWLTVPADQLLLRTSNSRLTGEMLPLLGTLMRPLLGSAGTPYGRAALWPSDHSWDHRGALISGGFRIRGVPHVAGLLAGEVTTAARHEGEPALPLEAISVWAEEQARLIEASAIDDEQKALCADIAVRFGADVGQLPIVRYQGAYLTTAQAIDQIRDKSEIIVHIGMVEHENDDDVGISTFDSQFKHSRSVFFLPRVDRRGLASFQGSDEKKSPTLWDFFVSAVKSIWGEVDIDDTNIMPVGEVDGQDILRAVDVLRRSEADDM